MLFKSTRFRFIRSPMSWLTIEKDCCMSCRKSQVNLHTYANPEMNNAATAVKTRKMATSYKSTARGKITVQISSPKNANFQKLGSSELCQIGPNKELGENLKPINEIKVSQLEEFSIF